MANTIPYPTFNWKATDQIRAWDLFQAKAELWLAGEEIKKEIQYTKIVLMLGDEGLSRWSKWVKMKGKTLKMSSQNSKKVLERTFPSELQEQHSTAASDNRKEKQQQNWISDSPNW